MRKMAVFALMGALHLSLFEEACVARLLTVAVTAEVTGITGDSHLLQGQMEVGSTIEGTYTYDTSVPDSDDATFAGEYRFSSPPCSIVLRAGGLVFQTDPCHVDLIVHSYNDLIAEVDDWDVLRLESQRNLPCASGTSVDALSIWFEVPSYYSSGSSYRPIVGLLTDGLPASVPTLEDWSIREIHISAKDATSSFTITARILSAVEVHGPVKTLFVDAAAVGKNNGLSWNDAYRSLQDALADANSSNKPVEIRVGQGVYRPDKGVHQVIGDRLATFSLINQVTLKGGYAGVARSDPNARDFHTHPSILTGDLRGDDLIGFHNRHDNSYHVVSAIQADETAVLDGFIVTSGYADGELGASTVTWGPASSAPASLVRGGGIYMDQSLPTVWSCTFKDSYASESGGAAYIASAAARIKQCAFIGNAAELAGGAICDAGDGALLKGCLFQGNSSAAGGVLLLRHSGPWLVNCTLAGNRTFNDRVIDTEKGNGQAALFNSLLWQPEYASEYRPFWYYYSDVSNDETGSYRASIHTDPLFARPGYWAKANDTKVHADVNDPSAVWVEGDYHLKSQAGRWDPESPKWIMDDVTSPCIDAGDPANSVDQEPFPNGGRINMGAYGGTAEASKSWSGK
jgi:hypothetical protein